MPLRAFPDSSQRFSYQLSPYTVKEGLGQQSVVGDEIELQRDGKHSAQLSAKMNGPFQNYVAFIRID